jgi:hypothetical protein
MALRALTLVIAVFAAAVVASGAQKPVPKIDPVAVVGCLTETAPGTWSLVNASEPVPSNANAPSPKELASLPKGGAHEFRLIGTSIFNLTAHRDHSVVVKGLPIKADPVSRLNVTSVTMVSETCPAK